MSYRSPMQRVVARLLSYVRAPQVWLLIVALLALCPDAAHAACTTFNVPDANTTPSTSPMASGGTIAINVGYQCDPFGQNPQSDVIQPSHGSVTLSGGDNTIVNYTNNGDGATSDSFVVQDASGNPFTINVAIAAATSAITVSPGTLPAPQVGTAYSQSLSASGGAAPYSYALTSGALPPGLTLSGNTISGTPTQAGSYAASITVTDSASVTATKSYSFSVPNPSSSITVAAPPAATVNQAYSYNLGASTSGATAPYSYSLTSGALPPGLSLSGTTISGTPTSTGTFNFSVTVTDSSPNLGGTSPGPYFKSVNLSISVQNVPPTAGPASATVAYDSTNNPITLNLSGPSATSVAVGTQAMHGVAAASGTSITYTPTSGFYGTDSFTYTATNGAGTSSPAAVSITIAAPTVVYAPVTPPDPKAGMPYSQSIASMTSGGAAPYTYAVTAGTLPAGLVLAANGVVSGTPTAQGTFTVQITATDSSTSSTPPGPVSSAPANVTFTVGAPIITVAPSSLPGGTVNAAYSQNLTASGGTASYTYDLLTGTLPNGITLSSSGVLSGTPTQAGNFTVTVRARDSTTGSAAPYFGTAAYTLTIAAPTITVSPGSLPNGTVGTAYSQTFSGSGGTAPYTFGFSSGALPSGMTLASDGTLSGIPTTSGNFTFTVSATDAQNFTSQQGFTLHVAAVAPGAPVIGTATGGDQQATVSFTAPASTGGASISGYTVTSNPGGFTASGPASPLVVTGLTNGTSYTFTVTATNTAGTGAASSPSNAVTPKGQQTITFNNPGTQNFGTSPQLTAVATSTLPITFSSSTTNVCTVTAGGSLTFLAPGTCTIHADQAGNAAFMPAPEVSQSFTIAVPGGAVAFATPNPLPAAMGGVAYSITVAAAGGAAPYTFQLTAGSLPAGVTLSPSGTLSGTPTSPGTYNFTLGVADAATQTATKNYQLTVSAPTIVLTPTTLPQGKVGNAYTSTTLSSSGGGAPYTYAVTGGALPTGLVLSSVGVLSGSPTAAGSFNFTVTATDHLGFQGSQAYSVVIDQQAPIVTNSTASTPANNSVTIPVTTQGGPITSIAITQQPAHGTASVSGISIAYTPATNYFGQDTLQYTATGPGGTSTPATVTMTVAPGPVPVAMAQSTTVVAGQTVTIHAITGATNGPFVSAAVSTPPAAGTTTVQGTDIVYTAPNASGTFGFDYTVSNPFGASQPAHVMVAVTSPTISITPATLPAGKGAVAYTSTTLSTSGGTAPYTYAVTAGALPAGLTLSSAGVLSGTPTAAGSFNITVTSTDRYNFQGTQAYTIAIAQPTPVTVNDTASVSANGVATITVTSNDSGPITSIAVTQQPTHGKVVVNGLNVVYTPTTDYFGSDTLEYTATGPGGTSSAATVNITVTPLAVPVVTPQTATVLAGKSITIHATTGASNGPFVSAAVVTPPSSGTAVVQGMDIAYTAAADASGTFGFDYTLSNAFGASKPAHVTLTVNPLPVAPSLTATVIAGRAVQVDLTTTAHGGPFTGAKVVSISPSNAGTASIASSASGYTLSFTAAPTFSGSASLSYTLSNAYAESTPGTVTVAVTPRSDPSKNAEVLGVLDAQADATRRMATGQISNFQQRLQSLHSGTDASGFSNGVTMTSASSMRNPQTLADLGNRQGMNRYRVQPDDTDASASAQAPAGTLKGGSLPGGVAVWTGGALNFGKMQTGASDNGIDFTTAGLSMGVDKAFSRDFAAGFGVGYGHDVSDVGQNGSRSALDSYNVAFYASYHPASSVYVDGLVGYQWLQFDARRYVTDDGSTVRGDRDGTQVFGSLSVGYEHQADNMMLTPYARLDVARAHLDGYTEHGDDVYSLSYAGQTVKTSTGTLGLLAQWTLKGDSGVWSPQVRAEFGHDMQGSNLATMRYADLLSGPLYQATLTGQSRNHTLLGAGVAWQSIGGWLLRAEYQNYLDNTSSGNQSILLGVEKKFDP